MFANFHDKKARILIKVIEKKDNIHYNPFCFSRQVCPFPFIPISLNLNKSMTLINFLMRDIFCSIAFMAFIPVTEDFFESNFAWNIDIIHEHFCHSQWVFLPWFLYSSLSWQDFKMIWIKPTSFKLPSCDISSNSPKAKP